jgi:hypothetical protein
MTALSFDHTLARQLLDDGHGITREASKGESYIFKKDNQYYSVFVTSIDNHLSLEQNLIKDIDSYISDKEETQNGEGDITETPITDYMIYPPAPAYGIKKYD